MRVFAKNDVLAKSKFWYFLKIQKRVKKANGEILFVSEIFEKSTNAVKNYGIVVRYRSNTGIHNMYKEMSGRHRAVHDTIHVVKATTVENSKLRRPKTIANASPNAKFPKIKATYRAPSRAEKSTFIGFRPNTTII